MSTEEKNQIPSRLNALGNLTGWNKDILEKKHHLVEKILHPSPYLPTSGAEVEIFGSRFPMQELPKSLISRVEEAGIPYDQKDTYHAAYIYDDDTAPLMAQKWEASLKSSPSSVLLAREIQRLHKKGIIKTKRQRGLHELEYYPVHITLGGIFADFPSRYYGKSPLAWEKRRISDWLSRRKELYPGNNLALDVSSEVLLSSECFVLARALDGTQWSTSSDRLIDTKLKTTPRGMPYLSGYLTKGTSGVYGRESDEKTNYAECIEIRTQEIWGDFGLVGMQRTLSTSQMIGAMLMSYQRIPIDCRDSSLNFDIKGDSHNALIALYKGYDAVNSLSGNWKLARLWRDFRNETKKIYLQTGLENPMKEYGQEEFLELAKVLKSGKTRKIPKFSKDIRDCVLQYRGEVSDVLSWDY